MKEKIPMQNLSIDQLITGAKLCYENSSDLIEEADILFQNEKFNRAYFLYQTAQEEIAKGEDLLWYAHDINIGLSRNFSGLEKSFLRHKRKNRTNFITLSFYEKENFKRMKNIIKIVAESSSFEETKQKIIDYIDTLPYKDEINRVNTFHTKKMRKRNDSLYVNYGDKNKFYLKIIKKKEIEDIKKETKYLFNHLMEGLRIIEDENWQVKGKELREFIKEYWNKYK